MARVGTLRNPSSGNGAQVDSSGSAVSRRNKGKRSKGKKHTADKRGRWHKAHAARLERLERLPVSASLQSLILDVPRMRLEDMPALIDRARVTHNIEFQHDLIAACLQRILSRNDVDGAPPRIPRHEQVRTLRRLIFGCGDTLLIARTGFGKSIIFHAYSVLTRKITLQLIPLNKLGDEQLADIAQLDSGPGKSTHTFAAPGS